ncbi:hypothetical protein MTP99_004365 [Tenebrio molitor]|nr:hypothetical protein MTP99_004365 [Tenebrio molitor]
MLKYAGLHPHSKSKLLTLYHYVNCFFFVFLLVLAIMEVAAARNDIFRAIEGLSSVLFMIYASQSHFVSSWSNNTLD